MKKLPPLIALAFFLAACSDSDERKPDAQPAQKPYNPWESQMKALNKAKGLEGQMLQDAKDRDKRMRDLGG
ncbi:hypothetical protein [Thiolapillus sp.]